MDTETVLKTCRKCGIAKPLTEFGAHASGAGGLQPRCRPCKMVDNRISHEKHREVRNAFRRANPQKYKRGKLEWHWKKKLGVDMTLERYAEMKAAQNDLCAICGRPENVSRSGKVISLAVDHCHANGQVRELLCLSCNVTLGKLEREDMLLRVLRYLGRHHAPSFNDVREAMAAGWEPRL